MSKIKGRVMTQAEEVRELRNWLRDEAGKTSTMVSNLHKKIDQGNRELHHKIDNCNKENQDEHKFLSSEISKINIDGKVNSSKVTALASLVSLVVSGLVIVAFQVMANG
jgi:hypothetical protein